MKKRSAPKFIASLLTLCMMQGTISATEQTYTATPSADNTTLNGSPVTMQSFKINDSNYVRLRDFAQLVNGTPLNFEVVWDGELNAINMYTQRAYTPEGGEGRPIGTEERQAKDTTSTIYVNGEVVSLRGYNIGNNNFFRLRDLGSALGIGIDWDADSKTVVVDSTGGNGGVTFSNGRTINNKIGANGYPDGPRMPVEERKALGKETTLSPTDVNHPGWDEKGSFWLCTLKPGEEVPAANGYAYGGIEYSPEATADTWSHITIGGNGSSGETETQQSAQQQQPSQESPLPSGSGSDFSTLKPREIPEGVEPDHATLPSSAEEHAADWAGVGVG